MGATPAHGRAEPERGTRRGRGQAKGKTADDEGEFDDDDAANPEHPTAEDEEGEEDKEEPPQAAARR